jgi:hypothetical protein
LHDASVVSQVTKVRALLLLTSIKHKTSPKEESVYYHEHCPRPKKFGARNSKLNNLEII